jgi:hypothetical protein
MANTAKIDLSGSEVRMEKLEDEDLIRFSVWSQDEMKGSPVTLTEKELIELLHMGLREGVLSQEFVGELRKVIEI